MNCGEFKTSLATFPVSLQFQIKTYFENILIFIFAGECIPPRTISLAAATFNLILTIANLDITIFQVSSCFFNRINIYYFVRLRIECRSFASFKGRGEKQFIGTALKYVNTLEMITSVNLEV